MRLTILLALTLLCSLPSAPCQAEEVTAKKVAVIEFDSKGDFSIPYAGSIVAEWMISELGKLGSFTLVERVLLKKVVAEQQLGETGMLEEKSQSAKLGKIYGVEAIVTGSILKWQESITITARLIDTNSGSILRTSSATARSMRQAPRLMKKLALEISGQASQTRQPPVPPARAAGLRLGLVSPAQPPTTPVTNRQPRFWLEKVTGIRFVWVEPGCFVMGQSRPHEAQPEQPVYYPDENPPHKVCVDGFWLSVTETNNEQLRRLQPEHDSGRHNNYDLNQAQLPAVMVSWQQARGFAASLSEEYSSKGASFRLPSEAEWEYAARAGSSGPLPWPEADSCQYANAGQGLSCQDGYGASAPVASFKANGLGLFDMHGNVWEWVEDVYNSDAYLEHERNNPLYLGIGSGRVIRGGSWQSDLAGVRSSVRGQLPPDQGNQQTGFRLVMERQ